MICRIALLAITSSVLSCRRFNSSCLASRSCSPCRQQLVLHPPRCVHDPAFGTVLGGLKNGLPGGAAEVLEAGRAKCSILASVYERVCLAPGMRKLAQRMSEVLCVAPESLLSGVSLKADSRPVSSGPLRSAHHKRTVVRRCERTPVVSQAAQQRPSRSCAVGATRRRYRLAHAGCHRALRQRIAPGIACILPAMMAQ